MNRVTQVRISSPLLAGLLYAYIVMGIATVITSLILMLTSQNEDSLSTYAYIIHALALFIGGWVAGRRSGTRGWYYGGVMGLFYALVVLLVGFLGFDRGFNLESLLLLLGSFLAAAFGGVLGVNTQN